MQSRRASWRAKLAARIGGLRVEEVQAYGISPPVVQAIQAIEEKEYLNKYELFREMVRSDPELYGAVETFSLLVMSCYAGVDVQAEKELDATEKKLLQTAEQVAKDFRFKSLFRVTGKHIIQYGDIFILKAEDEGKTKLKILPIDYMTVLEEEKQVGQTSDVQVFEPNLYVLNEDATDSDKKKVWQAKDILHISYCREGEVVRDLKNRYTFGVYSDSRLTSLKSILLWKKNTLINDILWRHVNVPRAHHQLDLSMFDPMLFPGDTIQEKIANATKAAEDYLKAYNEKLRLQESDEGYITGKETTITYVEPKKMTYASPNELLTQMIQSISAATGISQSALGGIARGSYASELIVGSFMTIKAQMVAELLKEQLDAFLREQVKKRLGDEATEADAAKVRIRLQLILPKDRTELARVTLMLAESRTWTKTELRALWGLLPLTKEQETDIPESGAKQGRKGGQIAEAAAGTAPEEIAWPETPESEAQH